MEWGSVLQALGSAFPYAAAFAVVVIILIVAISAMAAIWHPDAPRRRAAYRVLALVLDHLRRPDKVPPDDR